MFSKLRLRKSIAYLLIWLQLLTPGLSLLPVIARASEPADIQNTIQGLNALILNDATPAQTSPQPNVPSVSAPTSTQSDIAVPARDFSDYFHVQTPDTVPSPAVTGLPSLSSPQASSAETTSALPQKADNDAQENRLASGASQMGSLLSQDNTTDATINYARSIGEGLINQQVNEWLNQYGNAKVSLGNHKNLSGDLLLPLAETDQSLVFSQLGMRTNQDRNTVNLGVGYRQYINDWMLGINGFYDYDYTGENKRIGVGTEAWTDYLKLAANGYIRQTNWHQSKLGEMQDYDERPANGFDLRANAYLPSWPNFGGSLKYEQYFGKGVSMAESASPDDLKDNPQVITAGIDYTPFPLMTLSAKRSVGDSNATNVGVDFTYRFGVPWLRQIDPDAVGLMRSLVGSKYDFVDRNYNIVMQYRKQELITISLPATTTAQAAETVPVTLTVSKAKYGLKSISWSVDPLLTARGGHYQQISPTELRVTLPAYVFGQRANAAQNYTISAIATDNHDNKSNTAETIIGVIPSENTVGNLTLSPSDRILPANDSDSYTITGMVTDGKGAPLTNQNITFSLNGLLNAAGKAGTTLAPVGGSNGDNRKLTVTTGLDGKAAVTLRSQVAGEGQITATMDNGNASTAKVTFTADSTTAAVRNVTLMDNTTTKVADIKNDFTYTALVQDKFGNAVADTSVFWAKNLPGVTLSASTTPTDNSGSATVKLQSGTQVVTNIMVSASTAEQNVVTDADKKVSFIAGDIAADKSTLTASPDSIIASGLEASSLTLTLVDINSNPITGVASSLRTVITGLDKVSVSNFAEQTPGVYLATLTGTKAGTATITVMSGSKQASTQTPKVTLSADKATAEITDSHLIIAPDNAIADGKATNGVKATVTDKQGNPVSGMAVEFSVSTGAILTTVNGESDDQGIATALVTSTKADNYTVTASVNGRSMTKKMTFVANIATAHVESVVLQGSDVSKIANDTNKFTYTVMVKDSNGNPVPGATVTPTADKSEVNATSSGITNASGETTITLTSTNVAVADITVMARV
ncbi:inverse autotransporter beta domain-containing protein, partial [Citrobacter sp. JGM124]|uniref:inverse autotransporter beta domain-containing protein n=1 Tax=Citrobacter sp. JGM124 TaxID=2799789 RepID=UPI001BAD45DE